MNEQNKPADNAAQNQNKSMPFTKATQHTTPLSPWRGNGDEASSPLLIYNTLTRQKERFEPLHAPNVGMYVCGPTVYGDPHLGHARPAITFDVVFRYLQHLGYKVRYVRNITDVGHLEHDADDGDDKIAKKARLEQLEPMEIAQHYTNTYHAAMQQLNVLPPSIEPQASGHIIEQEELVKKILANGFAYESNGSIYFDIAKYNQTHRYGILSGRNLEDVLDASRQLDGVGEKRNQADFALWKHAQPEHIMRWPSPWGEGFPGWHCECTAMGRKYLGNQFDIHGGGMDLVFPHHECEIAQAVASEGEQMVRYWMHNNMITINGQKMGKSLGNFITLEQFFNGSHSALEKAYSPMTIRFFILSAHYRGTVDFSNEALQASEKGLERLLNGIADLQRIQPAKASDEATATIVNELPRKCYEAMNDDFQTPMVLSHLFEACRLINTLIDHKAQISAEHLEQLATTMRLFAFQLLGLNPENGNNNDAREEAFGQVVDMVLDLRAKAKADKDWATSDRIRDELASAGFEVKDTKDGATWKLNK
ncbi:cysteine--tRNA ligase [Hoylesella loescheii]|uniref:cysteine--tRNA ligase n=1 Tax=Hoylesella loescheii TaxID=840 RepID=UPI0026EC4D57|nr:cysteine--tRNA ligase [Hoylesella loescheii]